MNRAGYMKELRRNLEALPFEEREAAISYYEEYFDEAGPDRETETIESLGSPEAIAAELKADYAVNKPPKTPREGASKVWLVILAIFAIPIALPLAIALAAVIFSLFVALLAVIFSIGVAAIALLVGGILTLVSGFGVIATGPLTTLFFLGGGLALLGIGILFGYLSYIVAVKLLGAFARLLGRLLQRVKARGKSS